MTATRKPEPVGPVTGAPPTLEWIATDALVIDESYQRATESSKSQRIIFGMVKGWDWRLCQPLAVSRRVDGGLFVVDGQHRLAGALRRGDIPHLPCVVTMHADASDEAATFVALNERRQRLNEGDKFNAALASGDETAIRVAALIAECGLSLARHCNPAAWKPGQIFCAPAIVSAVKQFGERVVTCALIALSEAYQGKVLSRGATLLPGLYPLYRDHAGQDFDPDLFIETLGSIEQLEWLEEARALKRADGTISQRQALAEVMMREYRAVAQDAAA